MKVRVYDRETDTDEVFSIDYNGSNLRTIEALCMEELMGEDHEHISTIIGAKGTTTQGFKWFVSEMRGADMPVIFIIGDSNKKVDILDELYDEELEEWKFDRYHS